MGLEIVRKSPGFENTQNERSMAVDTYVPNVDNGSLDAAQILQAQSLRPAQTARDQEAGRVAALQASNQRAYNSATNLVETTSITGAKQWVVKPTQ